MSNENIIPFRPRPALTTCTLPEEEDAYDDETSEDDDEMLDDGDELPPIASRSHSIAVFDGPGGKSLLDACLPTQIVMEAVAFIMQRLELQATVPYSIDVFGGEGGKSILDASLPTHVAMAAVAFSMKQLEMTATA